MSIQSANNSLRNFKLGLYTDSSGIPSFPTGITPYARWDAADTSPTNIVESGNDVSQLSDKGPNGHHLLQATGLDQPKTGTRTLNGLNVLDFDGSNHYLQVAFGETVFQENTVYIVCQTDNAAELQNAFYGLTSGTRQSLYTSSSTWRLTAGVVSTYGATDINAHIFKVTFNGSSSNLTIDGVAGTPANAGNLDLTGLTLGGLWNGTVPWNGIIGECAIIEGALSVDNEALLMTYFTNKWGIPI